MARLPPLVLALARPGPGRLRYFVDFEAFVFFEINGISSFLSALKPSCSLSGSTCLVSFAPSFGTVFSHAVSSAVVSEIASDLTTLVLDLLALLATCNLSKNIFNVCHWNVLPSSPLSVGLPSYEHSVILRCYRIRTIRPL